MREKEAAADKTASITATDDTNPIIVSEEEIQTEADKIKTDIMQASSLINELMHITPDKRLSAREALEHPWFQLNPVDPDKAKQTLLTLKF